MRRDLILISLLATGLVVNTWWITRSNAALDREVRRLSAAIEKPPKEEPGERNCVLSVNEQVLRSEARRAFSGLCVGPTGDKNAAPAPDVTEEEQEVAAAVASPEAIKAFDQANRLVDQGLARRTWSAEDAQQLRPLFAELDPTSRDQIALRTSQSINEGKLESTGREIF